MVNPQPTLQLGEPLTLGKLGRAFLEVAGRLGVAHPSLRQDSGDIPLS
jgi:hypothetical protein